MTPRNLAHLVARSMFTRKASDVVLMDLRKLTTTADFFVVCSADSDVQVRAIADAVEEETMQSGNGPWHTEGRRGGVWIVLDFVDVVAHIFHRETRTFYNLERLWSDAPMVHVKDEPPPARKRGTKKVRAVRTKKKTTRK